MGPAARIGPGARSASENLTLVKTMETPSWNTTESILRGLWDDRDTAWNRLVGHFFPRLVGLGLRRGLSEEDAEDAAQEAFLEMRRIYQRGAYDRQRGRVRQLLWTIAKRRVIDLERKARSARLVVVDPSNLVALGLVAAGAESPEDPLDKLIAENERSLAQQIFALVVADVNQAINVEGDALRRLQLRAWHMHEVERMNLAEIALRLYPLPEFDLVRKRITPESLSKLTYEAKRGLVCELVHKYRSTLGRDRG